MGDFLYDENVKFFFSRSAYDYDLHPEGNVASYAAQIIALPINQSPAVFGLHSNAEINYFINSSKENYEGLMAMQTGAGAEGGGLSRDDMIEKTASDVQKVIPADELKFLKDSVPTPLEVVLLQEIDRYEDLVRKMVANLKDLKRALKGEIGMSQSLDELGTSLFNAQLPSMWSKLAPQTQKPLGSWVEHFLRRYRQYKDWTE